MPVIVFVDGLSSLAGKITSESGGILSLVVVRSVLLISTSFSRGTVIVFSYRDNVLLP